MSNPRSIINLISRLARMNHASLERKMKDCHLNGIVTSHGDILVKLFGGRSLPMTRLADLIFREKNTTTVLVRKLEELGYVKRRVDPEDKRRTMISLTGEGEALEPAFREISETTLTQLYQGFSESEKTELMRLLTKIESNLQRMDNHE